MSKTHDYTKARRRWAHDYTIMEMREGGHRLWMSGHGCFGGNGCPYTYGQPRCRIEVGDFLILSNGPTPDNKPEQTTRYKIEKIDYQDDPRDHWFAVAVFAPRDSPTRPPLTSEIYSKFDRMLRYADGH